MGGIRGANLLCGSLGHPTRQTHSGGGWAEPIGEFELHLVAHLRRESSEHVVGEDFGVVANRTESAGRSRSVAMEAG